MSYFNTDDIPASKPGKIKQNLRLTNPNGIVVFENVKSFELMRYYKDKYAPLGCNGKRIWREELIKWGYTIENVQP